MRQGAASIININNRSESFNYNSLLLFDALARLLRFPSSSCSCDGGPSRVMEGFLLASKTRWYFFLDCAILVIMYCVLSLLHIFHIHKLHSLVTDSNQSLKIFVEGDCGRIGKEMPKGGLNFEFGLWRREACMILAELTRLIWGFRWVDILLCLM